MAHNYTLPLHGGHTNGLCGNCGTVYPRGDLLPIKDLADRISAGEVVPLGACPDENCGALCTPIIEGKAVNPSCVLIGNLSDGFTMYGPFADFDLAAVWQERNRANHESWITMLHEPSKS